MRCIRSGAGVCGKRTLYFNIGSGCHKMFSNYINDKMHKICSANICNAHRELTANYNHTSSATASLVVSVSSGFHSKLTTQIKVCFTYFVHFAFLIYKASYDTRIRYSYQAGTHCFDNVESCKKIMI